MKRILSSGWFVVILGASLACGGAKYYMVKDPSTGKVYYSEDVKKKEGGAVTLTDAQSSSTVTIQNSEVTEVSEQTYKQGLAAPPPAAAPAAAGEPDPSLAGVRAASDAVIALSPQRRAEMEGLQDYLYANVYRHPRIMAIMAGAEEIVTLVLPWVGL